MDRSADAPPCPRTLLAVRAAGRRHAPSTRLAALMLALTVGCASSVVHARDRDPTEAALDDGNLIAGFIAASLGFGSVLTVAGATVGGAGFMFYQSNNPYVQLPIVYGLLGVGGAMGATGALLLAAAGLAYGTERILE